MSAFAGPVAPPVFSPDGGSAAAPLKVTIRCATPDAAIHITLDGAEPTSSDTEVDSGASVLIDEPLTLKAKAFLSASEMSATKTATYALTPVAGFGATFVEQGVPATVAAGRAVEISVVLRNIGAKPWTPEGVSLVPARARDAAVWNVAQVALKESVPLWKTATFAFRVTAPVAPGTYNLRWQLQGAGGKPFGEATPLLRVVVVSPSELTSTAEAAALHSGAGSGAKNGSGATTGAKPGALPEAVVRLKAKYGVTAGSVVDRVVQMIAASPHSFRALRELGLTQTDEEFEQLIASNPGLFRNTRIVRRDEQGRRVIPGWPGLALNLAPSKR
jgi:hypothetical protein